MVRTRAPSSDAVMGIFLNLQNILYLAIYFISLYLAFGCPTLTQINNIIRHCDMRLLIEHVPHRLDRVHEVVIAYTNSVLHRN